MYSADLPDDNAYCMYVYIYVLVIQLSLCILTYILIYLLARYTALHFALAFDKDGSLGEYLIEHGADDSIENVDGLTPYDGVAA